MLKSKAWCSLSLGYLKSQLGSGSFFFQKLKVSDRYQNPKSRLCIIYITNIYIYIYNIIYWFRMFVILVN